MSESLQRRRTTSNANTWVANTVDKENRCVLSRFLNVDIECSRDDDRSFIGITLVGVIAGEYNDHWLAYN